MPACHIGGRCHAFQNCELTLNLAEQLQTALQEISVNGPDNPQNTFDSAVRLNNKPGTLGTDAKPIAASAAGQAKKKQKKVPKSKTTSTAVA